MTPTDGDIVRFSRENSGGYGALAVADTAAHAASGGPLGTSGAWTAITFLADSVFTAATASNATKCPQTLTGATFPAGVTLYCNLSTFTLASGSCVAYYGPSL